MDLKQYNFLKIFFYIYFFFHPSITFILIIYIGRLWEHYAYV